MRISIFSLLAISLMVCLNTAIAKDLHAPDIEPSTKFAARMQKVLESMKETTYQHTTQIDENTGSVKCDCSGLVGFFLRSEFPEAYLSLRGDESPWRKRPLAVTYYETFIAAGEKGESSSSWKQVHRVMDVRPGDVIAWRKKHIKRGSTTGHVCIVIGLPKIETNGIVRVPIMDSSRGRLENDTRPEGTTGLGSGEKLIMVNEKGEPTGYLAGKRPVQARISIGRLSKLNSPMTSSLDAEFVGLDKAEASALAEKKNLKWRIIKENEIVHRVKWLIVEDRLNFIIKKGKITHVIRG